MDFRKGKLLEYTGRRSKTIPANSVVRVKCEAVGDKTVVEAMRVDGRLVEIVLANRFLRIAQSLF